MAESICRALRDGALDGEYAPALTIKDSIRCSFGFDAFNFVLCSLASNILAGKSQARGLVLVAFGRSPSVYIDLLRSRGIDVTSSNKWLRIIDCYSDPLGWKERLLGSERVVKFSTSAAETVCMDVRDLDKLFSTILELGKGLVGHGKVRFSIAIDLASAMLRYALLPSISGLISNLRSHDQVSSIFWLVHSDLHEGRAITVLEYMSSMVANLEPNVQSTNGQRGNSACLLLLEQNSRKGKLHVRFKRRNGRVKVMYEEFSVEQAGIKFVAFSSANGMVDHNLVPKVQFNLQLSEKERIDRAKVVLPFEHQGNGKPVQIYDGRQSLSEGQNNGLMLASTSKNVQKEPLSGLGEIHYVRDSDDELPDSDEDPDDDLDI